MNVKSIRGLAGTREYVCLSCQLRSRLSHAQQFWRHQHTSTESASLPTSQLADPPPLLSTKYTNKHGVKGSNKPKATAIRSLNHKARVLDAALEAKFVKNRREDGQWPVGVPATEDVYKAEKRAPLKEASKPLRVKKAVKGAGKHSKAPKLQEESTPLSAKAHKTTTDGKPVRDVRLLKKERLIIEEKPTLASIPKTQKSDRRTRDASATKKPKGSKTIKKSNSKVSESTRAKITRVKGKTRLKTVQSLSDDPNWTAVSPFTNIFNSMTESWMI